MNHEKEFFEEEYVMPEAGQDIFKDGREIAVYVTGSILEEAYKAAEYLERDKISVKLINISLIKPFSSEAVIETAKNISRIFTVEEHNIYGGLGSIIAESLVYNGAAAKVYPIGLHDKFAEGYGTHASVRKSNGLNADEIYKKIREILKNEGVYNF